MKSHSHTYLFTQQQTEDGEEKTLFVYQKSMQTMKIE